MVYLFDAGGKQITAMHFKRIASVIIRTADACSFSSSVCEYFTTVDIDLTAITVIATANSSSTYFSIIGATTSGRYTTAIDFDHTAIAFIAAADTSAKY